MEKFNAYILLVSKPVKTFNIQFSEPYLRRIIFSKQNIKNARRVYRALFSTSSSRCYGSISFPQTPTTQY